MRDLDMTKAILEFDLKDPEDKDDFKRHNKVMDVLSALYHIDSEIHQTFKHRELTDDQQHLLDEIRKIIFIAFEKNDINLDDLYE